MRGGGEGGIFKREKSPDVKLRFSARCSDQICIKHKIVNG